MNEERKHFIKQVVLECFINSKIATLPLPIEKVIFTVPHINIVPYSQFMEDFNVSLTKAILYFGSEDGCADYSPTKGGGIIYFNDLNRNFLFSYRYRWSLAHELGHILLKHHTDERTRLYRSKLDDYEYDALEEEADYFAQLMLVPHACLGNFSITKPKHIALLCKVSNRASKIRFREYMEWKSNLSENDEYDQNVFKLFYNFSFKRKCKNCKRVVIQRHGKYCIFCGEKKLEWSSDNDMIFSYLKTYESGKLTICPICQNEETNIEGDFCQICGTNLHNYCTNGACTQGYLPSNARFCPVCGTASHFYQNKFLSPWNNAFINIPDGLDEELPFN